MNRNQHGRASGTDVRRFACAISFLLVVGCGEEKRLVVDAGLADAGADATAPIEMLPPGYEGTRVLDVRGASLFTLLYLPNVLPAGGVGTVLERTPYRFADEESRNDYVAKASFYTSLGYAFVLQDVRGTHQSTGTFEPHRNEVEDGAATVDWIARQPWSNARIVTIGGSYPGFTAIAAAAGDQRVVGVFADDPDLGEQFSARGGMLHLGYLPWRHYIEHGRAPDRAIPPNHLDLLSADEIVLGRDDAYWNAMVEAEIPTAPFYTQHSLAPHYESVCSKVLVAQSGQTLWDDPAEIFAGLRARSCPAMREAHRYMLYPEPHAELVRSLHADRSPTGDRVLTFLQRALAGETSDEELAAQVWFEGGESMDFGSWPPSATSAEELRLDPSSDGAYRVSLIATTEPTEPTTLEWTVDPTQDDPCAPDYPYILAASAPLAAPWVIVGRPRVELTIDVTQPDADIVVFLYELPSGEDARAVRVAADGRLRLRYRNGFDAPELLTPGEPVRATIELPSMARRFAAGSRVLLLIASGGCELAENPHTGEPLTSQTAMRSATLRLQLGRDSRLILPRIE